MPEERLTLRIEEYRCDPCSLRQGATVQELVRMMPRPVIVMGKLVGKEYFCCPICLEPKFDIKTKRPVKFGATPAEGSASASPSERSGPVLVKS